MSTEQHEALPQLSGASLLDIKSFATQAENAAIAARSNTDMLIQAYLELQKQSVKQHALIVQMAESLDWVANIHKDPTLAQERDPELWLPSVDEAHAAATQYLTRGPKT